MATLLQLCDLYYHLPHLQDMLKRLQMACLTTANTIRDEAENTENHAERLTWAARVFATGGLETCAAELWRDMVLNPSVAAALMAPNGDVTDNDILYVVAVTCHKYST